MHQNKTISSDLSERSCELGNVKSYILHDVFLDAAREHPEARAVACLHQPASLLAKISGCTSTDGPHLRWTYTELVKASHAFAQRLHDAGLKPGQRVAAFLTNGIQFHIIFRACLELKLIFAPLHPSTVTHGEEVKHLFSIVQPTVVITQTSDLATKVQETAPDKVNSVDLRLVCDSTDYSAPSGWGKFDDFVEHNDNSVGEEVNELDLEQNPDDVVLILTTSGTTSLPKGCPITNRSLTTMAISNVLCFNFEESSAICGHLPVNHSKILLHFML